MALISCQKEGCLNEYLRGRGRHAQPYCPEHRAKAPFVRKVDESHEEHGLKPLGGKARSGQCSQCRISQDGLKTYCGWFCPDCFVTYNRTWQHRDSHVGVCDLCGEERELELTLCWLCPGCAGRLITPECREFDASAHSEGRTVKMQHYGNV
jgi:hypothetical protein